MPAAHLHRLALAAALAFIAIVCLPPSGEWKAVQVELCILCGQNGAAASILNVVLYLPLGAALWWRYRSLRTVVVLGALCSLAVELVQLVIPGRDTALGDLIMNTLGASLGGLLAIRPSAWMLPRGTTARLATALVALATVAMFLMAGVLFAPVAPPGDYYARWTPKNRFTPSYEGTVLEAQLGTLALPDGPVASSPEARALIESLAPVRLRFVVGAPPPALTAVFQLVAGPYGDGQEALQVGIEGPHLVLTPRFRADDWRVSRPEVQIERAMESFHPGDTVTLVLRALRDRGFEVTLAERPPELVGYTVARSWSLWYATFIRSEFVLRVMDLVWVAGLAAAVGWFALRTGDRAAALILMAAAAALVPRWTGLLPTPLLAYFALVAGSGAGMGLRRAAVALAAAFSALRASRAPAGVP